MHPAFLRWKSHKRLVGSAVYGPPGPAADVLLASRQRLLQTAFLFLVKQKEFFLRAAKKHKQPRLSAPEAQEGR